jgi:hypothetical protein
MIRLLEADGFDPSADSRARRCEHFKRPFCQEVREA